MRLAARLALALAVTLAASYGAATDASKVEPGKPPALLIEENAAPAAPSDPMAERLSGLRIGALRKLRVADAPAEAPLSPFFGPEGETLTWAAFRGKAVLVNFWATWCAPCVTELPTLDRLAAAVEAEGLAERVAVIAISVDQGDGARARSLLERIGVTRLALYREPTMEIGRAHLLTGLPTTLLIDAEGREVARYIGDTEWDAAEVLALLRAAAPEAPQ